jgi:hypothetical protein
MDTVLIHLIMAIVTRLLSPYSFASPLADDNANLKFVVFQKNVSLG